jgi:hypothetical protein
MFCQHARHTGDEVGDSSTAPQDAHGGAKRVEMRAS